MSLELFLLGLLVVSTLTTLFVEAEKKLFSEWNITYKANTLAGVTAIVLSVLVGIAYVLIQGIAFNSQIVVYLVALVILSWLASMVGYDKVVQAISQFKTLKEE